MTADFLPPPLVGECPACAEANMGPTGLAVDGCGRCQERELARSPAAFAAFGGAEETAALRAALVRLYPPGQRNAALERVRAWFDVIRAWGAL